MHSSEASALSFGTRSGRGAAVSVVIGVVMVAACSSSSKTSNDGGTPGDASSSGGGSGSSSGSGGGEALCLMPVPEIADAGALVDASGSCSTAGGATSGAADMKCVQAEDAGGDIRQSTDQPSCCETVDAGGGGGGGEACSDAGVSIGPDDGTCCDSDYTPSMFGQMGSDDDCKYDVSWTSTPVCKNVPVYFTVHVNKRVGATTFASGPALTGAGPFAEVVLNCTTPAPNANPPVEFEPGVYQVGPIVFTESGRWSIRFHFNENCLDEVPTSPHGHAAFWITVP